MGGKMLYFNADAIDKHDLKDMLFNYFIYARETPGHPSYHNGMRYYTAYSDDRHCLRWSFKWIIEEQLNKHLVETRIFEQGYMGQHLDCFL